MVPYPTGHDPEIRQVEDPEQVVIPLDYPGHIRYLPTVQPGDTVRKGQIIGKSRIGNCAFASISGKVKDIRTVWTAQSVHSPAVIIENDGGAPLSPEEVFDGPVPSNNPKAALERIRMAGVNAPWNLSGRDYEEGEIKALPKIETIIIKGVREEPTMLVSQLLLQKESAKVSDGLRRITALLPGVKVYLTVPGELGDWAKSEFAGTAEVVPLPQKYTSRLEREVVTRLHGRRVPAQESYINHGVAVQDVEYFIAMVDALDGKSPFIQKCLTISGTDFEQAITVRFPVGSSLKHILDSQGLNLDDYSRRVVGGPMKGYAQYSDTTPIAHDDGIYLVSGDVAPFDLIAPCIFCGRCSRVCPVNIQVHLVNRMIEFGHLESAKDLNPEACHECGLCATVCPAERPIVQLLHFCNHEMKHGERFNWAAGGAS